MKYFVISDIHGSKYYLEKALNNKKFEIEEEKNKDIKEEKVNGS